jgi:hypothetical protein
MEEGSNNAPILWNVLALIRIWREFVEKLRNMKLKERINKLIFGLRVAKGGNH